MFSVLTTPKKMKTQQSSRRFKFVSKARAEKYQDYRKLFVFEKVFFSAENKTQSQRFQILPVWRAFSFCDGLEWTEGEPEK